MHVVDSVPVDEVLGGYVRVHVCAEIACPRHGGIVVLLAGGVGERHSRGARGGRRDGGDRGGGSGGGRDRSLGRRGGDGGAVSTGGDAVARPSGIDREASEENVHERCCFFVN